MAWTVFKVIVWGIAPIVVSFDETQTNKKCNHIDDDATVADVKILTANRATGGGRDITTDFAVLYGAPNLLPGVSDITPRLRIVYVPAKGPFADLFWRLNHPCIQD
jgi:hypothetical protein